MPATNGTTGSTSTVSYVYAALDRRIGRIELDPDGITTRYAILYDADGEAFEVQLAANGDGNIVRHDFRASNRAGLLAVDEAKIAGPTQTVWTFADGAGTVGTLAVADAGGNWQWRHRNFDVHGSVTQVVGDSVASFGELPTYWRGMERDPFSNLYQSGTTVYDPTNGRYLSQATGSSNPYVYDNNRPSSPDRPPAACKIYLPHYKMWVTLRSRRTLRLRLLTAACKC